MSQIRTLSVERISQRIARLAPEEIDQLITGLNEIIAD
jgi:hypothetical protein